MGNMQTFFWLLDDTKKTFPFMFARNNKIHSGLDCLRSKLDKVYIKQYCISRTYITSQTLDNEYTSQC